MKRYDIISQTTEPMIGHFIKPIGSRRVDALNATDRAIVDQSIANQLEEAPCYRLDECLDREVGKRTFLATDVRSNLQVVVRLLLYYSDPQEKEIEESLLHSQGASSQTDQSFTMLPYTASFEVETFLGTALALVKPYVLPVAQQPPTRRCRTTTPLLPQVAAPPQIAYADFKVSAVPDRLLIQCLESRICAGIVFDDIENRLENWLLAIAGTIVFVGGTVATTGSIASGIIVAALLPVFFKHITTSRKTYKTKRQAIIRLSSESRGRTFLSLTTALLPQSTGARKENTLSIESQLHYSRLSVKDVTVAPAFFFFFRSWHLFGAKLTFTFYNHDAPSPRLCVVGSYKEIQWIRRHLSQWVQTAQVHKSGG